VAELTIPPEALAPTWTREPEIVQRKDNRDSATTRMLQAREREIHEVIDMHDLGLKGVQDRGKGSLRFGQHPRLSEPSEVEIIHELMHSDARMFALTQAAILLSDRLLRTEDLDLVTTRYESPRDLRGIDLCPSCVSRRVSMTD
jgi:hypothetical protein